MIQPVQPRPSPVQVFDLHFPVAAQRTAVEIVINDYARAQLECEALFQPPERRDITGERTRLDLTVRPMKCTPAGTFTVNSTFTSLLLTLIRPPSPGWHSFGRPQSLLGYTAQMVTPSA